MNLNLQNLCSKPYSNYMLPLTYNDILVPLTSRAAPTTRAASRNKFYQHIAPSTESERRLCYAGPKLWKNVDPDLKKCSFYMFKKRYKSQILDGY